MKHTATPAGRPTARCIWNSFRASGKRHLILTGTRGSGKSTLLAGLLPYLRETGPVSGITTRAQPGEAVFLTDAGSGRCAQIGAFDPRLPGPENRMQPCLPGFLSLGVPLLQQYGGRLADNLAGRGAEGDLPGDVKGVPGLDRLGIGADGRGGLVCGNFLFHLKSFLSVFEL